MQPPKCPVCGFEHWQIEGCGLSRKDVVDHKDPAVIAERNAEWDRQGGFFGPLYENVKPTVINLLGDVVNQPALPAYKPPETERFTYPSYAGELEAGIIAAGQVPVSAEDLAAFDRAGDLTREVNAAKGLAAAGFGLAPIAVGSVNDGPIPGGAVSHPVLLEAVVRERGSEPVELLSDGVALKSTAHPIGPKGKRPRLHASALETVEVSDAGWTPEQKERAIMLAEGRYFRAVRKSVKMSQAKFSAAFGMPLGTLRGWESGRRPIPRCVMVLLSLIECEPAAVMRVILEKRP